MEEPASRSTIVRILRLVGAPLVIEHYRGIRLIHYTFFLLNLIFNYLN